ncbi:gibberellin-regulated protein 4-like isoform X1 [Cucurbita pepo subsp. pepo]|uniref:gibberellin-regulated protein 4-like isoform X1 n=1 Tax=Cucurbita pepo subsp. pepo TaxID=3664 RepID=UPI000C9D9014|nr:gibberellin-regulated protein 4-like isoform X1 [Cucurbita pepo subsp. pepo]
MAMAKFAAILILFLIALSMFETTVMAGNGRGGRNRNPYGPGSVNIYRKYSPNSKSQQFLSNFFMVDLLELVDMKWVKKLTECPSRCASRCGRTQYHKPCMFFCQKCCRKCLCVPPGYYGNKGVCPCYNNWKTKEGGPKCP